MTGKLCWKVVELERPPLDERLEDWEIHRRRPSHLNARRPYGGRMYFLKWYFHRCGLGNPALREFENARRLAALDIPSVKAVGWGTHAKGTFLMMEGSAGKPIYRLEELPPPAAMEKMAVQLAAMVAALHDASLCHRDLYLDHVLIDGDSVRLIDVGRVMKFRRRRWIVKDLGGLLFSAWRDGASRHLCRLFLRVYLERTRRHWNRKRLLRAIQRKARTYRRHNR